MDGPPCADETEECRCSECMTWDAVPDAVRYEVVRETISTGATYKVGSVYKRFIDEEGTMELPKTWCMARDSSFPREGVLYRYQVRACSLTACGAWSDAVHYRGAPYACFDAGREIACYVGDAVVTR